MEDSEEIKLPKPCSNMGMFGSKKACFSCKYVKECITMVQSESGKDNMRECSKENKKNH